MRTVIVGAGGTGAYFGGLLARAGADVTFVARGVHGEALAKSGLTVKSQNEDFVVPRVKVLSQISEVRDPELVLVFVKSYSTSEVARALASVVTADTTIITFQTGLENDREIQKYVKLDRIYPGLIYINSRIKNPGCVEQISGLCTLTFGARENKSDPVLDTIESFLKSANIKANCSPAIELEMWLKLVWIAAFSGMTVLYQSEIGKIVHNPDGEALLRRFLNETFSIAASQGIEISDSQKEEIIKKIDYYKAEGKHAKTSLLLDLEKGQRTEVDTVHGTLLKYAREAELDCPLLQAVYSIVKVKEMETI